MEELTRDFTEEHKGLIELRGRVEAVKTYLRCEQYPNTEVAYKMLAAEGEAYAGEQDAD